MSYSATSRQRAIPMFWLHVYSLCINPWVRTPADAMGTAHIVAIVALQAFVMVAGPSFVAVLVELSGTHLAAAAAVRHRADPRGTRRRPRRTLAHHWTASSHLREGGHSVHFS